MTVDGDATEDEREFGRQQAHIVLSNPDMLHHSLLRNHSHWARLFRNMRFCVLDEAHTYHGAFGAHVALIIRRMVRMCRYYGNNRVQFVCCSATLASAESFFNRLIPRYIFNLSFYSSLFHSVSRAGAPMIA